MGSSGLRERKRAKTERLLEETGLTLFERQGFDETSVAEIAEATEVSPRTFFRYFGSKEDLIFAAAARRLSLLREYLAARDRSESNYEALRQAMTDLCQSYEQDREEVIRRRHVVDASPRLQHRLGDEVHRWGAALGADIATRNQAPSSDLRIQSVVLATMGVFTAAYSLWTAEQGRTPLAQILQAGFSCLEEEIRDSSLP
jgi:AcrR family transcriptional regulator